MKKTGLSAEGLKDINIAQNDSFDQAFEETSKVYKLTAFKIENFKAFHNTGWIDLNRMTILLGNNSAGKSALFQALQMLVLSYEYLVQEEKFTDLSKFETEIGNFDDIKNKSSESDIIKIWFRFEDGNDLPEYHVHIRKSEENNYGQIAEIIGIKENNACNFLQYYNPVNIFFLERKPDKTIPKYIEEIAGSFSASLRKFAQNFQTISAHRYTPERIMHLTGTEPRYINASGRSVYELLYSLPEIKGQSFPLLSSWLNKFGYSYYWKMSGLNRGEFMLKDLSTGTESNLVDNGFGISQSLPLAVAMDRINGKTILIDSPEAFLQTGMQSEMADLLIHGSQNGRLLLETGSEYIILRIQRRIAEGMISNREISVYFLQEDPISGAICSKINLDENGEFQDTSDAFQNFFHPITGILRNWMSSGG